MERDFPDRRRNGCRTLRCRLLRRRSWGSKAQIPPISSGYSAAEFFMPKSNRALQALKRVEQLHAQALKVRYVAGCQGLS